MQIQLTTPCHVSAEKLQQIKGGHYCADCKKMVTDYSNMTDAELLRHIQKNGLGCGQFRTDQLNKALPEPVRIKSRTPLFYLLLFASIFTRQPAATAQVKQDTVQLPCKQTAYDNIDAARVEQPIAASVPSSGTRRFGGATLIRTKYKRYSFFWGLIKFKIKQRV